MSVRIPNFEKLLVMTSESEFLTAYRKIKTSYADVFHRIDEAIAHEEEEHPHEAIATYERCVQLIDDTFAIPVGLPENIDAVASEWQDACSMIQKLKGAKTELSYRLKALRSQHAPVDDTAVEASEEKSGSGDEQPAAKKRSLLLENPVEHSVDGGQSCTRRRRGYKETIQALREVMAIRDSGALFDTFFQSQAKLYKIQPDGVVSTLTGDTSMSLVMCTVDNTSQWEFLNGIFFIQCSIQTNEQTHPEAASSSSLQDERPKDMIWIYPLIPTVTTCYRTDYGAFIFPDMESDLAGSAFGIMITLPERDGASAEEEEEQLGDLQQFFLDLLEAALSGRIEELKQPSARRSRDTSEMVSRGIVCTADFIARNLVWGAEKTGELMVKGTPLIMSKMTPASPDAPPVSTTLQTSVTVAKNVTSVAVGVTGWVAGKVGSASMALGRYLAPHIQNSGAALLEKGFGYDSTEANNKMEGAMTIAAGAVEGFTTVYTGLETSAKILGTNLSDNSVKIIEHKYGASAGNVAAGTFETLGNAFNVSQNVNYITPKGLAKKMAKNTGKAVVDDYKRSIREEAEFVPAGLLYPDLRTLKEKPN